MWLRDKRFNLGGAELRCFAGLERPRMESNIPNRARSRQVYREDIYDPRK